MIILESRQEIVIVVEKNSNNTRFLNIKYNNKGEGGGKKGFNSIHQLFLIILSSNWNHLTRIGQQTKQNI
jgi:hypothetical protein